MTEEETPFNCYQPKQAANPRGLCCVIANFCAKDQYHVNSDKQIYTKDGDIKMINDFFETTLRYEYLEFINKTKEEFIKALNEIKSHLSLPDNKTIDRLFLFVLSHGSEKGISTCQNNGEEYEKIDGEFQFVPVEMITSFFDHSNIPSLKDQPKCIFIQACRGSDLTKIAVKEEDQEYMFPKGETGAPIPGTNLEETEDNVPEEQEESNTEGQQQILEETELPLTTSRGKLRPSSENILVCYSCQKGESAFLSSNRSHFISKLIKILTDHYKGQHLLDMVVEVTRVFGRSIVSDYPYSLIFPYDSSYQAELSLGTGLPDVPFSVHATSPGSIKGEVKEFGSHLGIIIEKSKKIENRSSLWLHCTLKHKRINAQMQITLQIQKIEDEFLKHGNFEIDNSKNSLLLKGRRTIGFGKVTTDYQTIVSIEKEVRPCSQGSSYHIVYENGEKDGEFIIGKECRIWKCSPTGDDRSLVAVGQGTMRKFVPHVNINLYQLPIFESTLTKKFYLAKPPERPNQNTLEVHCLDGNVDVATADGSSHSHNLDVTSSRVSQEATLESLNKRLSDMNLPSSTEDDCDRYCKSLADRLRYVKEKDGTRYHEKTEQITKIAYQ